MRYTMIDTRGYNLCASSRIATIWSHNSSQVARASRGTLNTRILMKANLWRIAAIAWTIL